MPIVNHPLESSFSRLEKFRLYETATFYYLVGFDNLESMFRLLKINRLILKPKELAEIVREDDLVYNSTEIAEILKMIDEGNKASGGLVKLCSAFGVVGFVKFLDCFYLNLITQRKEVGCIAGNFIYSIKATEMFPVRPRDEPESNAFKSLWKKLNKKLSQTNAEVAESRYMGLFQFVDMTKDFFFSYTYDLTHSLQHNYMHASKGKSGKRQNSSESATVPQEIFQWNYYQIGALQDILGPTGSAHWIMPLIYGSYQQKRFSIFGKCVDLIMIARRSRHYAGTRYLKRGINVHGKAANDCEVEQVIQNEDSYRSHFCSYLQVRASIPTYWYQETSVTMPKPPILINRVDPDYRATEEHFADMFRRYSAPIIALDLVKQHEKRARESMVGREFRQAVEVVNESIPLEHKVRYIALDYSRITSIAKGKNKGGKDIGGPGVGNVVGHEWKSLVESSLGSEAAQARSGQSAKDSPGQGLQHHGSGSALIAAGNGNGEDEDMPGREKEKSAQDKVAPRWQGEIKIDVLRELEDVANMTIAETGFFCNTAVYLDRVRVLPASKREQAKTSRSGHLEQRGILRTNCIDCLDRTNGAQFAVAMKFLTVSLQALGICSAQQGLEPTSQMLVSLMEMYGEMGDRIALQYGGSEAHRKVPGGQVASSAKQSELLTSIKRYYSNAFTDTLKQDALNVFLGCFQPNDSSTPLWDLDTDYNLHNTSLCPPPPLVNKVLFGNLYLDSYALGLPVVRQLIESSIKKALTDESKDTLSLVPVNSKKKLRKLLGSEDLTIRTDKIDDVVEYLKALDIPDVDRVHLLKSYFVRNMAALQAELDEVHREALSRNTGSDQEHKTDGKTSEGKAGSPPFPSRMQLKIAIRNIGRLEKRKFLRTVASRKISGVAGTWWKSALEEFEDSLYGSAAAVTTRPTAGRASRSVQKPPSYFNRVYTPNELSEFDVILNLDFFSPVDAAHDITELTARPGSTSPSNSFTVVRPQPVQSFAATDAARATLSRKFDREYLSGRARSHNSYAFAHMHDEFPAASVATNQDFSYNAGHLRHNVPRGLSSKSSVGGDSGYVDQSEQNATANAGFQIARYMRKLVGGFLRKDDNAQTPTSTGKPSQKSRGGTLAWNWYHHMINFHEHRVSRKSSQLYSRYEAVAQNNLILMDKMGNQRLAEEEYFILLRDYNIDADNVTGMEHLSIESYVSSEVNQGVYQGMQQRESAIAAHCFLMTSLAQVEAELQQSATSLPSSSAVEPFAPSAASTRPRVASTPLKRGQQVGNLSGGNGNASKLDSAGDAKHLVRNTMQRHPTLDSHVERCLARVGNVRGLEREFRKNVSDYINQQSAYAKEISYDHMSTRLGSGTSESTIIEYSMLFDHLSLAKDLEQVDFLASCHPAYETFEELSNLRQTLAPLQNILKEQKAAVVQERAEELAAQHSASAGEGAATVSEQLGLGSSISGLQEDLKTDYSLDNYNHPFPYLDNIALPGLVQPHQEFFQLDYDLYVRSTNPFMQLNEAAATSLVHALSAY